jgi:hypothetical protein
MTKYLVTYLIADYDGGGVDRLRAGLAVLKLDLDTLRGAGLYLYRWGFIARRGNMDCYIPPSAILEVRGCENQQSTVTGWVV